MKKLFFIGMMSILCAYVSAAGSMSRWAKTKQVNGVLINEYAVLVNNALTWHRTVGNEPEEVQTFACDSVEKDSIFAFLDANWVTREIWEYTDKVNWDADGTQANRANLGYAIAKCDKAMSCYALCGCEEKVVLLKQLKQTLNLARAKTSFKDQVTITVQAVTDAIVLQQMTPCGYIHN
ncbi:MAG: hypothetical protein MJZ75_01845 [Paludibacteraceae bacterium]|nr:hypothetical protein [Paludibacteraceae bacterium]